MTFRRRKTRRQVRCTLCTPFRWMGTGSRRRAFRDYRASGVSAPRRWTP
ncbi:MAG: hypothetical protein ACE10D_12410 [Planctomycetota bacterium]|nr:hypothetical protein [Planctomycetota bacterium]